MASYLLSFDSFADDINSPGWKTLTLDSSDATFANPASGHHVFDISGSDIDQNILRVGLAWVDCDVNKANSILGVTKYVQFEMQTATRRTALNNGSDRWVYESLTVSAGFGLASNPFRTLGIGPMIDTRASPRSGIVRRIVAGIVFTDLVDFNAQLIITPARII